ncbi:MAG: thioredoxin family protein [Runella sp.]
MLPPSLSSSVVIISFYEKNKREQLAFVERVKSLLAAPVKFIPIEAHTNPEVANSFGVTSEQLPLFIEIINGKETWRQSGKDLEQGLLERIGTYVPLFESS